MFVLLSQLVWKLAPTGAVGAVEWDEDFLVCDGEGVVEVGAYFGTSPLCVVNWELATQSVVNLVQRLDD